MTAENGKNKTISILGCGWYGLELAKKLITKGYTVSGSCTSSDKLTLLKQFSINAFLVNFQEEDENYDPQFFDTNILFICIPPGRSSNSQHSYLSKIKRIAAAATAHKTEQVIFISSTSVYGDQNNEVTEDTTPVPETESGKAILASEQLLKETAGLTTTIIRFGGLIGPARDPGRFFAGKIDIPNGQAPVNLIHLDDCLGLTITLLERQAFGYIYNACAPSHPAKADFYTAAALRSALVKPVFKDELLNWKIVTGKNVSLLLDYTFSHDFLSY